MKGLAFRISAIAFLMVFVPTIIFSIYEFSTLKKNDEIVKNIYNNQLEAILFSLNQYSEDIIGSIASEATEELIDVPLRQDVEAFFNKYPFIQSIFSLESELSKQQFYTLDNNFDSIPATILASLEKSRKEVEKLFNFFKSNYQKIEPIEVAEDGKLLLVFAVSGPEKKQLLGFYISTEDFALQVLRPKITQVAQDKFIINMVDNDGNRIYRTHEEESENESAYSSSLWLLPGYKFQIQLVGETIEMLVEERSRINLIIILVLDFALLLGALLMFLTLRKETKLNTLKSEFVSNVSHEIRTPLALIKMYIETLSLGRVKAEEKRDEYYKIIFQETNRLSSIVNKILSFSKIDSGKQKLKLVKANLNSIVNTMLESYEFHMRDADFEMKYSFEDNLPEVEVDEDLMLNVFINLMDNAIKYSDAHKEIQVETGLKNNEVFFRISDNGFGISEANQKHIFDKFYRVTEGNLAHKAKGSGLGLSIVKNIVEAHKGHISVSSKAGEGSVFTVYLPFIQVEKNIN